MQHHGASVVWTFVSTLIFSVLVLLSHSLFKFLQILSRDHAMIIATRL